MNREFPVVTVLRIINEAPRYEIDRPELFRRIVHQFSLQELNVALGTLITAKLVQWRCMDHIEYYSLTALVLNTYREVEEKPM